MRVSTAAAMAGVALAGLTACSKPPPSNPPPAAPSSVPAPPAPRPLTQQDLPHRKPGLWRQTMVLEGADQPMPAMELCADAASEAKLSVLGQTDRGRCQTRQFTRNLDGSIGFSASCDMGEAGKSVSTGLVTGDFNTSYKAVIDTKITGAAADQANGEHKMTITATWLGPCAPGQKGGDMIMPGGRVMNLADRPGGPSQ